MKIEINRDGCISCGLCVEACPQVFRLADDGLAEVYAAPLPNEADAVKEAADNCPVQVIAVK